MGWLEDPFRNNIKKVLTKDQLLSMPKCIKDKVLSLQIRDIISLLHTLGALSRLRTEYKSIRKENPHLNKKGAVKELIISNLDYICSALGDRFDLNQNQTNKLHDLLVSALSTEDNTERQLDNDTEQTISLLESTCE
jgi:hypothetical protein